MATMKDLLEKVNTYATDCADAYTSVQHLRFNTHGCLVYPTRESNYTLSMQGTLNKHALSQVVERLDAPRLDWIDNPKRCPEELKAKILNNLAVARPDDGLFIRHKGDNVRAVVSHQYTKFDNALFVDMVAQAVDTLGAEVQVLRPAIGDELSAYILIPSITFAQDPSAKNRGNGGLHPAIHISNSEIGTGAARTDGGLYQRYCENGTIYGWNAEEALQVRHRYISAYAMRSIVASGIASALKMSEKAAFAYVASQEIAVEETSLKSIIGEWGSKYGLSISAKDNWLKCVTAEKEIQERETPMLIDVVNGATYSAHTIENVKEREMIERMAGDILYDYAVRRPMARRG